MCALAISKMTQRRFVLGKRGLYPEGKAGVCVALRAVCVVQIDPLAVVAHNQDIVLYGRVLEYRPADLQPELLGNHQFLLLDTNQTQ